MDHDGYVHIAWANLVDGDYGYFDRPVSLRYCRFDGVALENCAALHSQVHRIRNIDMAIGRDNSVHISYLIERSDLLGTIRDGNYAVMYSQIGPQGTFTRQISNNPTDPSANNADPDAQFEGFLYKPVIQVEEHGKRIAVYYESMAGFMIEAESEDGKYWEHRRVFKPENHGGPNLVFFDSSFQMPSLALPVPTIVTPLSPPPHIFGGSWSKYVDGSYNTVPIYIVGSVPAFAGARPEDKDGVDDLIYHSRTEIDEAEGVDGFNYWWRMNSLQMYLVGEETQMSWHWTEGDNETHYDDLVGRIARYRIDGQVAYEILDDIRLRQRPRLYVSCDAESVTARFVCIYRTGHYERARYVLVFDEDGDGTFEEVEIPGSDDIQGMRESTLSIRVNKISFVARDRDSRGLKVVVGHLGGG